MAKGTWAGAGRTAAGAALAALLLAGAALAADNEVRMPVEKTVRTSPLNDAPVAKAEPESPKAEAKKPEPAAVETPKPEAPKPAKAAKKPAKTAKKPSSSPEQAPALLEPADNAAAESGAAPAEVQKTEAAKVEPAKPEPKQPEPKKPEPKKPEPPKVDPKAFVMPAGPANPAEPIVLPADGAFAGDIAVVFEQDRLTLSLATNGRVERVTYFGVESPRKLALDLRGPWRKKGAAVVRFDTGPIKAIVVGEHPDRLRLAVEFREGAVRPDMEPAVEVGERGISAVIPLAR